MRTTELPRIGIVSDFEHVAVDVSRVACQERLNVITVNTLSPLRAEDTANGLQSAERAKTYQPDWRMTRRTLRRFSSPQACGIVLECAQHSLHWGTSMAHTSLRCALVGVQATPLIGTIS